MRRGWIALSALLAAGCGYVGDPLPPALNIPVPVSGLTAVQRGANLVIEFTPTLKTTEGLLLSGLSAIDLRAGAVPAGGWNAEAWAAAARPIEVPELWAEPKRVRVAVQGWVGQQIVVAVRTGAGRRYSEWSNPVAVRVVAPLETPGALNAEATAEGVRIRWTGWAAAWRVLRKAPEAEEFVLAASVNTPAYVDTGTEYGKSYSYIIQGTQGAAESELSAPVTITPEDRFPPAVPKALDAIAGVNSVELVWERGAEADLRGYYVYRAEGAGEFIRLNPQPVEGPTFSDKNIEAGKRYRYAVASIDGAGNESSRCLPVEITAP